MRCLVVLFVSLVVQAEARTCDCAHNSARADGEQTQESVTWINDFLKNLYQMNSDNFFQLLAKTIEEQAGDNLPSFVNSVSLTKLDMVGVPAIDLVTHSVTTVVCDDVTFKRYTLDFDISLNSPGVMAAVKAVMVLGVSASITVEDVDIKGILRIEILLSSDVKFPAMQNVMMTFIDRPQVDFAVELYDLIGFDTFGIDKMIHNTVEDAIQEKLVYPGMMFWDMTGDNTTSTMMPNNPTLHPAVLSANITVTPLNVTQPRTSLEGWLDFGDDETKKTMLESGLANHQFDIFLQDFRYSSVRVRVMERFAIRSDITWLDVDVQIPTELRLGSLKRTYYSVYTDGRSSWNVTVDIWTMLLPSIQMMQSESGPALVPSLFTQTNCSDTAGENGVLYVKLHGAANLTISDNDVDSYVYIKLDGKMIGETDTNMRDINPVYDFEFEKLIRSTGKRLTDHTLEFTVYDWDRWSSDDLVGNVRLPLSKTLMVNEPVPVIRSGREQGKLFITMVFRPVPFF